MAFIGAYPAFPAGDWPKWPLEIALEGAFITHWIMRQQHEPSDRIGDGNTANEHPGPVTIPSFAMSTVSCGLVSGSTSLY